MLKPRRYKGFIDTVRIRVCGGAGGMGNPKFGGVGGKGGDVILCAQEGVTLNSLLHKYPKKTIRASCGSNSHQKCIIGRSGDDHVINVPIGINVINDKHRILGELNERDSRIIVAKGGPGGCQETGFSGLKGEQQCIKLDLKLIADIGLVGFPNAGKSTLLRALTRAKPKIASYPFTTIKPNVGKIKFDDLRTITLADLPGLIEGAHKNVGMGHTFLRHCERTKLLLWMVDIQGFQLNHKHISRTCLETVILLNKELELYREYLLDKPTILIVNKMDLPGAWEKFRSIEKSLYNLKDIIEEFPEEIRPYKAAEFDKIIPASIKTSVTDAVQLKQTLRTYLDIYATEEQDEQLQKGTECAGSEESKLIEELKWKHTEMGPVLT